MGLSSTLIYTSELILCSTICVPVLRGTTFICTFIEHSCEVLLQTIMSNALQYKASKGFRYISYICKWCLEGGGGGVS